MSSMQQRTELQAQIWKIANDVRGSVDGWDFKQFVLGSLFYRFISENFEAYIEAGDDSVNYAGLSDSVITPDIFTAIESSANGYPSEHDYIFDGDFLLISEDGANLVARNTPIAFSISGKSWVNNHAHVLKFNTYAERRFVEYYLNSIDLTPYISGAAQPKLNQKGGRRSLTGWFLCEIQKATKPCPIIPSFGKGPEHYAKQGCFMKYCFGRN